MKTFITGASGFVGSAVLRQLIKTGHYKRSKFLAEAEMKRLAEEQDVPVVISILQLP